MADTTGLNATVARTPQPGGNCRIVSSARSATVTLGRRLSGFQLGAIFSHYQRKALPCPRIAMHFETEAFFEQRLQHGVQVFLRGAILDGAAGLTYATLQAFYEYLIVLKTKELRRGGA